MLPDNRVKPAGTGELPASLGEQVLQACAAPVIVFEAGPSGYRVRYVNPAFARRTGYSPAEIAQCGWDAFHVDGGREPGVARLSAAMRERQELEMPLRIYCKNGTTFSAELHVSPLGEPGAGMPGFAVGVLREGSANAEYVSRLERDAHYDPLTGLPNRRLLAERAGRALERARSENQPLAVALVDLDEFKAVNDGFGHAAGDEVLCAAGARLARDLRAGDFVARLGGDEFVLLLQETKSDFALASMIERVRRRIELPMHFHGVSISIACSIGVAVCPKDGANLSVLLEQADRAMYRQKVRRPWRAADRPALCPAPA